MERRRENGEKEVAWKEGGRMERREGGRMERRR